MYMLGFQCHNYIEGKNLFSILYIKNLNCRLKFELLKSSSSSFGRAGCWVLDWGLFRLRASPSALSLGWAPNGVPTEGVRISLICLILELYDFHNIININMRTLIHEDLFFNMLIKDDHKTGFLLFYPFLTFTRLSDGEENASRTWLKEDQFLSLNKK